MFKIDIPGMPGMEIENLVLDYNGTIAVDGEPVPGVAELINSIARIIRVHVITADSFGGAARHLKDVDCKVKIIPEGDQDKAKLDYIENLGASGTAAIGNGRNDCLMLEKAALGICIIMAEGACAATLMKADIVCSSIIDALSLFEKPVRMKATLRK